jgi:uncharacterized protein
LLELITTPNNLPQLAQHRQAENMAFKKFLRNIPSKEIDTKVHAIATEVSSQIDCTQCANCCKSVEPGVHADEIENLAKHKQMTLTDFVQNFVSEEPETKIQFLKRTPCIFLKENKCSIYAGRPSACADYPHLHQPQFKFRWKSILMNYQICPIVFNTVETLKDELGFLKV